VPSSCPICNRPLKPVLTDRNVYAVLGNGHDVVAGLQTFSCGPKGHIIILSADDNGVSGPAEAQQGANGAARHSILNSWKEIAAYLGRGVRTVQRWERDLGLPVRRPRRKDRSTVLAFAEELDAWLQNTPVRSPRDSSAPILPRKPPGPSAQGDSTTKAPSGVR
jgi:hypothetical protein